MNPTGILSAVGARPTIGLERLFPESDNPIFAKLKYPDPSGTVKDRTSLTFLQQAILAESSTGATVSTIAKSLPLSPCNATIAFFIADREEPYLDSIYS